MKEISERRHWSSNKEQRAGQTSTNFSVAGQGCLKSNSGFEKVRRSFWNTRATKWGNNVQELQKIGHAVH